MGEGYVVKKSRNFSKVTSKRRHAGVSKNTGRAEKKRNDKTVLGTEGNEGAFAALGTVNDDGVQLDKATIPVQVAESACGRQIALKWVGCGELIAIAARIDFGITCEVEDDVAKSHKDGVGFTDAELQVMNDKGMEKGLLRIGSECLTNRLDSMRPKWKAEIAAFVAEDKTVEGWSTLVSTLGTAKKRGTSPHAGRVTNAATVEGGQAVGNMGGRGQRRGEERRRAV